MQQTERNAKLTPRPRACKASHPAREMISQWVPWQFASSRCLVPWLLSGMPPPNRKQACASDQDAWHLCDRIQILKGLLGLRQPRSRRHKVHRGVAGLSGTHAAVGLARLGLFVGNPEPSLPFPTTSERAQGLRGRGRSRARRSCRSSTVRGFFRWPTCKAVRHQG